MKDTHLYCISVNFLKIQKTEYNKLETFLTENDTRWGGCDRPKKCGAIML